MSGIDLPCPETTVAELRTKTIAAAIQTLSAPEPGQRNERFIVHLQHLCGLSDFCSTRQEDFAPPNQLLSVPRRSPRAVLRSCKRLADG
jgi:hypothetical protein